MNDRITEPLEQLHHKEKLAALEALLAGVAHELSNPLTVITQQSAILDRALRDDPRQGRARMIVQAANSCSEIVRNFLALARHEPARRVPASLNDVVRAAIDPVAHGFAADGIELTLDLSEPIPALSADPQQLERVVINLVSNAQYALRLRPSPRRLTVRSGVDAGGERVQLSVADNGGGIPPDLRRRIFDPFFTTKPAGKGTGLGLAICHEIISAHNGTIVVSSEIGTGATFVISLPIASPLQAPEDAVPEAPVSTAESRILVVDDDPYVAASFSGILSELGYLVDIAASGKAALELIGTVTYAVIVADMQMPGLDGLALYWEVTASNPFLQDSFLFVTGDTFRAETKRFLMETGVTYLGKPCTFQEVERAVERVLLKRQANVTTGSPQRS